MRHFIFSILATIVFALSYSAPVNAQDDALVKIRLLPERADIQGGDEIWIGLEQSIAPHWHTYWKNPGDSGTPTAVEWTLPEGFKIGEIQWPAPQKLPFGPLLNYGYENNVILLQKLTVPDELPKGDVTLTADVELLVCKEECIPEYGTYTLTLNGIGSESENNSVYLQTALKQVPAAADWSVKYSANDESLTFTFEPEDENTFANVDIESVAFFPLDWGVVQNSKTSKSSIKDGVLTLTQAAGDRPLGGLETISGVLRYQNVEGQKTAVEFSAKKSAAPSMGNPLQLSDEKEFTILKALLFALIGGLILNLMPCVFPVLSIKALSLLKTAEKNPGKARIHGLSYTAGVILSFLVIAFALIILKAGGAEIGWGFQLQNPIIISILVYLMFVIGLNLAGFFDFANPFANTGGKLAQSDGYSGSFFTGVLATVVATPCTAPFMAGAVGFALVQPAIVSLLVFAALGFGLALPYLALSFAPNLQKIMPKPGAWMDTFKQFLSFPMFIFTLWLLYVLGKQVGTIGMSQVILGAVLITFAIWMFKHRGTQKVTRILAIILTIISLVGAAILIPLKTTAISQSTNAKTAFGEVFTQERLDQELAGDAPVFVEMTAAWCITCKVNHAVALNIDSTKELFKTENVTYLVGDWTNEDPIITKFLNHYGRAGVPIYVFYGARNTETGERPAPKILPQVLTPGIVKNYVSGKS